MATTELDKALHRMKVTVKVIELAGTPARGFSLNVRTWRITLSKEVKGEDKPLKLTLTMLSPAEPTMAMVVQCLADDIENGELSLWDFLQQYSKGKNDPGIELMHKTCKRTGARVQRFFGDSWVKLTKTMAQAA